MPAYGPRGSDAGGACSALERSQARTQDTIDTIDTIVARVTVCMISKRVDRCGGV